MKRSRVLLVFTLAAAALGAVRGQGRRRAPAHALRLHQAGRDLRRFPPVAPAVPVVGARRDRREPERQGTRHPSAADPTGSEARALRRGPRGHRRRHDRSGLPERREGVARDPAHAPRLRAVLAGEVGAAGRADLGPGVAALPRREQRRDDVERRQHRRSAAPGRFTYHPGGGDVAAGGGGWACRTRSTPGTWTATASSTGWTRRCRRCRSWARSTGLVSGRGVGARGGGPGGDRRRGSRTSPARSSAPICGCRRRGRSRCRARASGDRTPTTCAPGSARGSTCPTDARTWSAPWGAGASSRRNRRAATTSRWGAPWTARIASDLSAGGRRLNLAGYLVQHFHPWERTTFGVEYLHWVTRYLDAASGVANRLDTFVSFSF